MYLRLLVEECCGVLCDGIDSGLGVAGGLDRDNRRIDDENVRGAVNLEVGVDDTAYFPRA